jgi:hypothetical protein
MENENEINKHQINIEKCYNCQKLLEKYQSKFPRGEIVDIKKVDGMDAYNPSSPFSIRGEKYHLIRVEPRDNEFDSHIHLCKEISKKEWELYDNNLNLNFQQDPFISKIGDEIVIGGVKIIKNKNHEINYKTIFYRGESFEKIKEFASGPIGQKDIRLVDLEDRIGIFTRPKNNHDGLGSIGYTEIESLNELNENIISNALLLTKQCIPNQWWGVNEGIYLGNNLIGVIGHIAMENKQGKHYWPIAFVFNSLNKTIIDEPKIISTREDWPETRAKRKGLEKVLFLNGTEFTEDGEVWLYPGLSDAKTGVRKIDNPFI